MMVNDDDDGHPNDEGRGQYQQLEFISDLRKVERLIQLALQIYF